MPKRVQDIIPSGKRTIKDSSFNEKLTNHKHHTAEKEVQIKFHKPKTDKVIGSLLSYENIEKTPKKSAASKKSDQKMLLVFIGSALVIAIIGYFASQYYAIAKFTIVPTSYPAEISKTVIAQAIQSEDVVKYDIKTVSEKMSVDVLSTNGKYEESKATGKVTIFNSYSNSAQRLIAGTRLSTPEGLIYKLSTTISVPGKSSKGDGQVSVAVIADKVGKEYNLGKSRDVTLKVLGFKDTPKYSGFYARLASDISGGFSGTRKNISKTDMASSTSYLERELLARLSVEAHNFVSDNTIIFDQGILFSTSSVSISDVDDNTSRIEMTGTVNAITFDKRSLFAKLVGENTISRFDKYSFDINNIENLHVSFTNLKDFSIAKKSNLLLNIDGSIVVYARIPINEIRTKLIGLPLSQTYSVIRSYSDIIDSSSRGEVMPPWSKVPTSADNIEIKVEEVK